jgi:hypothetical protein
MAHFNDTTNTKKSIEECIYRGNHLTIIGVGDSKGK